MKERFWDWLVVHGIFGLYPRWLLEYLGERGRGGFYRYETPTDVLGHPRGVTQIIGPHPTYEYAAGPMCMHFDCFHMEVKHHWQPPEGTIDPEHPSYVRRKTSLL